LSTLIDVTLVNRVTQLADGRTLYSALPITLSFSRNQLGTMGELEVKARQRVQRFNEQMELQTSEVARFRTEFEKFGLSTPNEKRAAILCRRAESEMFSGNADSAELLFQQARDLAPQSAYVHAKAAAYELARNRVGVALERANEACSKANSHTGALCYTIKARILDVQRDKAERLAALEKAISYDRSDPFLKHQYGVALSRMGREGAAVDVFTEIVCEEEKRTPPRETLVMALTTRVINLKRLGRVEEARRDLGRAKELVARYPQLRVAAGRLEDLDAELAA
jgi:Flp pilus assembly protein TadD